MNETLITDLVAMQAMDQLVELDNKMEGTLDQFQRCARELATGLKIPVEVTGDIDRLNQLTQATMRQATQAAQQYTQQIQQQQQVIANTTNTISRQLAEQEKVNKAQREAYQQDQQALSIANQILGSREQNYKQLAKYNAEMKSYKDQMKELEKQEKQGLITADQAASRRGQLMQQYDKTKVAAQELTRILAVENKEANAATGSYQQLSQQLERMKQAYKQLNEAEKAGEQGLALEAEIQNLDAHLKDLGADMGEFQRNVGNYAVAGAKSLRTELRELTMQMAQMLANGVDPTSEAFLKVAERAGTLKDAMADATSTINDYANDTKGLTNTISVIETSIAGWQTFEGALSAFGFESEAASKATQKLIGIMSMMNGIQKISTEITTNGTGAYRAYHAILKLLGVEKAAVATATAAEAAATQANAAAATEAAVAQAATATSTEAATVASVEHTAAVGVETAALTGATAAAVALKLALAALGIGAVIALIVTLYQTIEEFNSDAEEAAEITKGLNDAMKEGEKSTAATAAELKYYVGVVNEFNGSAEEEKRLVDELNKKYGDSLGYYQSIAQWKSTLTSISEYYIDVLKWEAIAQANLNKYAEATAEGNWEAANAYEAQFEFYKKMAAKQSQVVQNLVKLRGGSTSKPTSGGRSGRRTGRSTSKDNGAEDAAKAISDLIDESEEMLSEWEKTAYQRSIALTAVITSTSEEQFQQQVESIRNLYEVTGTLIEQEREKAVAEKEKEYAEAIEKAKKYGKSTVELEQARITAITALNNDYLRQMEDNQKERDKTISEMETSLVSLIEKEAELNNQDIANTSNEKLLFLRNQYLEELRLAEDNEKKIAEIRKRYARESAEQSNKAAIDAAQATVDGLEKAMKYESLSKDERVEIARRLAKAKIALAKAVTDAEENQLKQTIDDEAEAAQKRKELQKAWVDEVADSLSKVADIISSSYDSQIDKVQELIDAEQERHDAEMERIDEAAERGAITKEEAEIRKREAEAQTAKKQEELEKRKSALEYKKATVEKANSAAQTAIATALGVMQTYAQFGATPWGIALAAFVSAMGAVQVASILAQPIKAYAEGTKGHPHEGGLAVVGDGGKAEVVMFGRKAWLTPDTPTLIDLPKGAEVLPDATQIRGMEMLSSIPRDRISGQPIIINDYHALEERMEVNTKTMTRELRALRSSMARELRRQNFRDYINRRT